MFRRPYKHTPIRTLQTHFSAMDPPTVEGISYHPRCIVIYAMNFLHFDDQLSNLSLLLLLLLLLLFVKAKKETK